MEKGMLTQESAPPYPGPPLAYAAPPAAPQAYPSAPPPVGYQPVPQPGVFPQQSYGPPPSAAPMYQPGPGPVYGPPPVTVTTTQVFVTQNLREFPGQTVCPVCRQTVVTNINHVTGALTWIIAAVLFFVGCFLCCCIPFCVDSCKDVEHHCPSCRSLIYTHRRM